MGNNSLEYTRPRGLRKPHELRKPLFLKVDVLSNANGSAYFELGGTKLFVSVVGPVPDKQKELAEIKCNYSMAAFSTEERIKKKVSKRAQEISLKIKEVFEDVILLDKYPNSCIFIDILIVSADAGTRVAAITACSVALAQAGIRMKALVSAISVGKYKNEILLDLQQEEDCNGEADMPICYNPLSKEYLLLQFDGEMDFFEFEKALKYARFGCHLLYILQQYVLFKKFYQDLGEEGGTSFFQAFSKEDFLSNENVLAEQKDIVKAFLEYIIKK